MNVKNVVETLSQLYPDKNIIENKDKEGKTVEIICELTATKGLSEAIAVIDRAIAHHHKIATETYEVIRGKLILNKDKEKFLLQVGDTITIEPGEVHSAEGNETWIKVVCRPGWNRLDHIIAR